MSHSTSRFWVTLLLALAATACGSMKVNRIPADPARLVDASGTVDPHRNGVVLQVPAPHAVVSVMLDAKGERVVKTTQVSLPSREEFYELDFRGGWLKSRELVVKVHPNGALNEYSFTAKQKASEAITGLAEATSELTKARLEVEKAEAEAAAASDPVTVENAELQLQLLNMMLKANLEALEEGRELPFPGVFQ